MMTKSDKELDNPEGAKKTRVDACNEMGVRYMLWNNKKNKQTISGNDLDA